MSGQGREKFANQLKYTGETKSIKEETDKSLYDRRNCRWI